MTAQPVVRVGVGAFVVRADGKFLLGLRASSHGAGTWQLPGGHLEVGESWGECGAREVLEEAGVKIGTPTFVAVTNDVFDPTNKHYITIFVKANCLDAEPVAQVLEPEKCKCWEWVDWEEVFGSESRYRPLFLPMTHLREQITKRPW
ncbi:hypothetical protein HDU90_005352 [Geranomyces variabilis]|nr:hypothetical protein HDU90_005352 [Geranomyces variabilis]